MKAVGVRASVGELCELRTRQGRALYAEVVGFRGGAAILTPFGDITGLSIDADVIATRRRFAVPTGSGLLGRVLDGFGNPLDGRGPIIGAKPEPVDADPPPALSRKPVSRVCETGVRAIDTLLSIGEGQRVGVVAPVGVGKTTLMGMLARGARADVTVVALIGERGREVGEFLSQTLGPKGLSALSGCGLHLGPARRRARANVHRWRPPLPKAFGARVSTYCCWWIPITRYVRALREIGLASGETPTRRGFPPSVFAALPRLLERAGNDDRGAITRLLYLCSSKETRRATPLRRK